MRIKNTCLNCHFLTIDSNKRAGLGRKSLEIKYRNFNDFTQLVQFINHDKHTLKCFRKVWDGNISNAEKAVFGKKRGKKCALYFPCEASATLNAMVEYKKEKLEIVDRKITRIIAVIAIVVSFISAFLTAIL